MCSSFTQGLAADATARMPPHHPVPITATLICFIRPCLPIYLRLEIELKGKLREPRREHRSHLLPCGTVSRVDRENRGRVQRVVQLEPRLDARVAAGAEHAIHREVQLIDSPLAIERARIDQLDICGSTDARRQIAAE